MKMHKVYALSPKGQRECLASQPTLPAELRQLLRLIDGRRTQADVLAASGKSAITAGGLRWLTASGYIQPADMAPTASDRMADSVPAAMSRTAMSSRMGDTALVPPHLSGPRVSATPGRARTDAQVCDALASFMVQSIRRRLGENGYIHRRQIERATHVTQLLPHLSPLLDAIVARAGAQAGAEFADTAAFLLHPLERDGLLN